MDSIALQTEVRTALSLSDELGRHEHALGNDSLAGHLAAVRSLLVGLERQAGRPAAPSPADVERLDLAIAKLRERALEVPMPLRPRLGQLLAALDRIVFAEARPTEQVPAKPLLGVLPLARVVPQDAHSVLDYAAAAAYFASAKLARTARGRFVGAMLGAKVTGVSAITDYRLSLAKVVPIEAHEGFDYIGSASAIAAPFVLGYVRKDPVASLLQIGAGIATLMASLVTDYRADKGIGRALRSRGGPGRFRKARRKAPVAEAAIVRRLPDSEPGPFLASFDEPRRVSEVQRPLEGLAGPSYLPDLESLDAWEEPVSSRG